MFVILGSFWLLYSVWISIVSGVDVIWVGSLIYSLCYCSCIEWEGV